MTQIDTNIIKDNQDNQDNKFSIVNYQLPMVNL